MKILNTIENGFYEILTKTNLSDTTWTVDHGVIGEDNLTVANAISVSGKTNLFFLARNSGLDEDGDGLPDWWELENGLDPTLADTGNTGTSDGYKDGDGDGWSNLEEFQNGTSPSGFNTPPAPRGLTVSLNTAGTVANLSWNPNGGAVTGYEIERYYYDWDQGNLYASNSVSATVTAFSDPTVPEHHLDFPAPTYRVRANYASGNSEWTPPVSIYPPATSARLWLVRGPEGIPNLAAAGISDDTTAIKVTRIDFSGIEPVTAEFSVSTTNFVNGIVSLDETQVPFGSYDRFIAQTVSSDGRLGDAIWIGYGFEESIPFFDGREQLKQNLSFVLRAADMAVPFNFTINHWTSDIRWGTEDHAYASFFEMSDYEDAFYAQIKEFRPFEDNHHYRNFAYDTALLDEYGQITNGVSWDYSWNIPLLTESLATYHFQPPSSVVSIPAILSSNVSERIYHQIYHDRIGLTVEDVSNTNMVMATDPKNIFGLDYLSIRKMIFDESVDIFPGDNLLALPRFGGQELCKCVSWGSNT